MHFEETPVFLICIWLYMTNELSYEFKTKTKEVLEFWHSECLILFLIIILKSVVLYYKARACKCLFEMSDSYIHSYEKNAIILQ